MNTTLVAQPEKSSPNLWISGLLGGANALIGVLVLYEVARLLDVPLQVAGGTPA